MQILRPHLDVTLGKEADAALVSFDPDAPLIGGAVGIA